MRKTLETGQQRATPLLTPKQVAAQAAYKTPVSILRAFRRGELLGHKLNARTIRFHPRDVARWLSSTRISAKGGAT
jgi:hypothetical protein